MTTLPDPIPGLVIRYAYLWRDEALRRREEGTKYRSAMVVLVATEDGGYGTTHHCYRKRVANKEYPMVGADFGRSQARPQREEAIKYYDFRYNIRLKAPIGIIDWTTNSTHGFARAVSCSEIPMLTLMTTANSTPFFSMLAKLPVRNYALYKIHMRSHQVTPTKTN